LSSADAGQTHFCQDCDEFVIHSGQTLKTFSNLSAFFLSFLQNLRPGELALAERPANVNQGYREFGEYDSETGDLERFRHGRLVSVDVH